MAMGTTEGTAAQVTQPGAVRVRRALLTVSDKRGLVDFAKGLAELGVEIVSTGGTARELESAGIETRPIDDYTGFPEILDGRVKTLNPRIYAGLLAVRSKPEHVATLGEQEIEPIDLVCVNLYPFERTAAARGASVEEIVENIDIGGPTLIRAAAKNHGFAAVVTSPESYDAVIEEMRMSDGLLSEQTRESLAMEAFGYTARYDAAIARWFAEREDDFPALYPRVYEKVLDLPYGENRSEEHTSELQSRQYLVCRLLLEKKKKIITITAFAFDCWIIILTASLLHTTFSPYMPLSNSPSRAPKTSDTTIMSNTTTINIH